MLAKVLINIFLFRSNNVSKMVFQGLVDYYSNIIQSGDSRSDVLPYVRDPIYVLCAVAIYITVVIFGPRFMENRNALKLREIMIGYNFMSVILSVWMMWEVSLIYKLFNMYLL